MATGGDARQSVRPGKPSRGRDSAVSRLEAFGKAIDQIAELPELKSIGFPYGIGCGLAGGDWNKHGRLLEDFAGAERPCSPGARRRLTFTNKLYSRAPAQRRHSLPMPCSPEKSLFERTWLDS